jgi:hypothetical protein
MKTYPLRKFVHRVLLVRLGLAAAVIAVVVGLITYHAQHLQFQREVADLERRGMLTILEKVRFVMERQLTAAVTALRDVLGHGDPPVVYRAGRFVYVQVYDRGSAVLADQAASDQPGIDGVRAFMASRHFSFPGPGEDELLMTSIGDASFVFVSAAVADQTGNTAAFTRGMFAVSP